MKFVQKSWQWNLAFVTVVTIIVFLMLWIPRQQYADSPIVGHHAFKSAVHIDTIKHIKDGWFFVRSDLKRISETELAADHYLPDDGFLFYIPALLPQIDEKSFRFYRVQSLIVSSLSVATLALAILWATDGLLFALLSLIPWFISPLFTFYNQSLMAEPFLLLGVSLLLLGTVSQILGRKNAILIAGLLLTCLAKMDGLIIAALWTGCLLLWNRKQINLRSAFIVGLISAVIWAALYIFSHSPIDNEAFKYIGKAYADTAEKGSYLNMFLPFKWFVDDALFSKYLTISIVILGLGLKSPLSYLIRYLSLVYVVKSLVLFGYSDVHNYYQFPFLAIVSMSFASICFWVLEYCNESIRLKMRSWYSAGIVCLLIFFSWNKFTYEFVVPLYRDWAPGVETFFDSDMNYKNFKKFIPGNNN